MESSIDDSTFVVAALLSVVEAVAPVDEDVEDKDARGSRVLSHEGEDWADDWEEREPGDRC